MSILQAGLKPVVHTHGSPSESAWVACGWGEAQSNRAMIKDMILNQLILPSVMGS